MTRFTLDANVLVYAEERDDRRQAAAALIVERASQAGGVLTLQVLGEFFQVVTRKRKLEPALAARRVAALLAAFPNPRAPTEAALRHALAAAVARRFSYWDALLLATAAEAGCAALISEDMGAGAALAGCRVVTAFAPNGDASPAALALLAGWAGAHPSASVAPLTQRGEGA